MPQTFAAEEAAPFGGLSTAVFRMKGLTVSLTEAGQRASRDWKAQQHGAVRYWIVPIASRQIRQVIGIRGLETGKAEVEFAWSWMPNKIR